MTENQRRFRILHLIDHLGSGGAQEALCQLVKYRNRSLFSPEVVCLHGFGHYFRILQSWGIPVQSLLPRGFARVALPVIFLRLVRFLAGRRFDLVHTHLIGANVLGSLAATLLRVPVRITHDQTHDDVRRKSLLHRWLDMMANRLNHHIIAVSASIRDFLRNGEGLPPDKISLVYNAVDLERFTPAGQPEARYNARRRLGLSLSSFLVGGVGRLHYQKNFPLFLQVAAEVSSKWPEVEFVIAGEGPEQASLLKLRQSLGLHRRVHFLGFVRDMATFYQSLDLLLLTSHFEGTPLTVLEAMAMGVPVVASAVDGVAEILEHEQEALLAAPGNLADFVGKVALVLEDQELRHRLRLRGQEKVRRHFSAAAMVRQVEEIYLRYLGARRSPGSCQNLPEIVVKP